MAKITTREKDYSQWYIDIVLNAKLADYAPVRGCMVIRPNGYAIWEKMHQALDGMFKETGHVNAYFPLFIPESFMKKEAEHVEGFSPECAVVTHGGGKELEEKLYVRPTSETIIWSMYKKWIQSYRDLPLLYNQWANVVRWEMRTRLFLRTTEFLWQEGHTAHETYDEAEVEALKMIRVYQKFAEEYMAVPVIVGKKSDSEKFAGALHTYCIEAMMQDNKALQAGTSHHLGQNFAKAFEVTYQDRTGQQQFVYATSWGVSTRLIGALIMAHSDDQGLVVPPKLAPTHVVIIPIFKSDEEKKAVCDAAYQIKSEISSQGFRVNVDDRDQFKPGWKFNEYELLGVPLRIEIGPRDLAAGVCTLARRDSGEKTTLPLTEVSSRISGLLDDIQSGLFLRAKARMESHIFNADTYAELEDIVKNEKGFSRSHWCGSPECEAKIKDATKATIRCIPLDEPDESGECVVCKKPSVKRVLFSKAY
ncbi:MAG: proline--tRNA ligase [Bacteroidetes bacterium]|nr:proline--tRNA ligase [Bacteroidota bacterium]